VNNITINKFARTQTGFTLNDFAPTLDNKCGCGCNVELTGRKTRWASLECSKRAYIKFSLLKGNTSTIRTALYKIDNGFCRSCGVYDEKWQADHIVPVHLGGGGCEIDNFQTLCNSCHLEKSIAETKNRTAKII